MLPSAAMPSLRERLELLPQDVRDKLERHHFDPNLFERFATRLRTNQIDNRVRGQVEAAKPEELRRAPNPGSDEHQRLSEIGRAALQRGECALIVLAGGMATRMGGVVKALVEAVSGKSFLDLRVAEVDRWTERTNRRPPLWLMTSHATDRAIKNALGTRYDPYELATFVQHLSLRLTPDADLFVDETGSVSEYAPGHGDLPQALRQSGLLERFVQHGGKYVMVTNVDNLGATLDPALIGWHLENARVLSCELVDKVGDDRGGIPSRLDGRLVILEEFRLPTNFDPATVRVFNTNTFHFDARTLLELDMEFSYFAVNKKVGDAPVVQFERLLGEVTSHLPTTFLHVPRDGVESRFLPVKDNEELDRRRAEIGAVLSARGILP